MTPALIAFGANLGEPGQTWERLQTLVGEHPAIHHSQASQLIRTRPVGFLAGQPDYFNAALYLETNLEASKLFLQLQAWEKQLGRDRSNEVEKWSPRTIDLDMLLFGNQRIDNEQLIVPHPRMSFRRFVLEPACQVAPQMVHPDTGATLLELLSIIQKNFFLVLLAFDDQNSIEPLRQVLERANREENDQVPFRFHWKTPAVAKQAIESWKQNPDRWDVERDVLFCMVKEAREFDPTRIDSYLYEHARLVVKLQDVREGMQDDEPVKKFAGPSLILKDKTREQSAREMMAAFQAMLPLH